MEEKIQEELEKRFNSRIKIEVKFKDFRIYEVNAKIEKYGIQFEYMIDATFTLKRNCDEIERILENYIIKYYKEEK